MASPTFAPPPFPEPDQPFDTPEEAARAALQALLVQSIGNRNEFGGVICKFNNKFHVAPYFVGERNSVSPGLRLRNKGCMPVGAEAVADPTQRVIRPVRRLRRTGRRGRHRLRLRLIRKVHH